MVDHKATLSGLVSEALTPFREVAYVGIETRLTGAFQAHDRVNVRVFAFGIAVMNSVGEAMPVELSAQEVAGGFDELIAIYVCRAGKKKMHEIAWLPALKQNADGSAFAGEFLVIGGCD